MSQRTINQELLDDAKIQDWLWLYRVGAWAALASLVIIPISIAAFFVWPLFPDDILTLIQTDKLAGLMGLDLMYLLSVAIAIPFFLVLYVTLEEIDRSWTALALALGLVGLVCLVPARPIVEVFALSDRYAAAGTEAERIMIEAAAQAILSLFHGTAFHLHYILGSISLLISAILMLRSELFGRTAAYVGIVTNIVVFGLYVPGIGVYLSMLSVLGYMIWYALIAGKLWRLVRNSHH